MKKTLKIVCSLLVVIFLLVSCDSKEKVETIEKNQLEEATIYYSSIEKVKSTFFTFINACMLGEFTDYRDVILSSDTFITSSLTEMANTSTLQKGVYRTQDGFIGIYLFRYSNGDCYTIRCGLQPNKISSVELLYNGVGL